MRFAWFVCLWLCLIGTANTASAAPSADVPVLSSLLVDETETLTPAERETLLSRLQSMQASGRIQAAIFISKGIGDTPLAEYALKVAEASKLGRRDRDDGLLILVVPSIEAARLEVGYGLEGDIPDARASQWVDELLSAMREREIALGLERLLNRIDEALPHAAEAPAQRTIFDDHPEWGGPFALVVFSLFSVFPLFVGRWGSIASGVMLAAFLGGAAFMFWGSEAAGFAVAAGVVALPFLWGLNREDGDSLPAWVRRARAFGNMIGVAMFFAIVTLFVGVGIHAMGAPVWPAVAFSGMLSMGLVIMLFPGRVADCLSVILRSAMHFVFILVVVYVAMLPFTPDPSRLAVLVAGAVTACAALGLYLDSRPARGGTQWSKWLYGLAAAIALPFAVLALILSIGGEDLQLQIAQAIAGGGSLAGILAAAARLGLIAAVKIGLGGAFGGGGAGRRG